MRSVLRPHPLGQLRRCAAYLRPVSASVVGRLSSRTGICFACTRESSRCWDEAHQRPFSVNRPCRGTNTPVSLLLTRMTPGCGCRRAPGQGEPQLLESGWCDPEPLLALSFLIPLPHFLTCSPGGALRDKSLSHGPLPDLRCGPGESAAVAVRQGTSLPLT